MNLDDNEDNKQPEEVTGGETLQEEAAQESMQKEEVDQVYDVLARYDLPDFREASTTEDLVAAHAAMAEVARNLGISVDHETNFVAVETGMKACERLIAKIAAKMPAETATGNEDGSTTEGDMSSTKTKKARAKKAPKAAKPAKPAKAAKEPKAKKAKGAKKSSGVRAGSKTEGVKRLLTRASGCTSADVRELTGWPAVSMPAMAKACGLKLEKEKVEGKPTRYYGK